MLTGRQVLSTAALFAVSAALCSAQNVMSAHSGTVHYFEGDVTVDGTKLVSQVARFTELKEQSVLHTGMGRAEILLTPGVILRVGENSSVKMLDNRLLSTRLEFLGGSAMLETMDSETSIKDPAVTLIYKDFQAQSMRNGIFEMSSQPSRLKVFKGEAKVSGNGMTLSVKDGNVVDLTMTMAMARFDAKEGDDLYLWSRDRSAYLAAGNMASARSLQSSGYGNSFGNMGYNNMGYLGGLGYNTMGYGNGLAYAGWNPAMWNGFSGGWYYNSYLNMYSFLPFGGTMYSPFGYGYYNPVTIGNVYMPSYYWSGSGGSRTGTTTGLTLNTVTPSGSTTRPTLPRLGSTATIRPTLATAAPGTSQQSALRASAGAVGFRNSGNTGFTPSANNAISVSSPALAAAPIAAPAAAAAPRGAAAPRR